MICGLGGRLFTDSNQEKKSSNRLIPLIPAKIKKKTPASAGV